MSDIIRAMGREAAVRGFLAPATTAFQYTQGVSNPDAINPDAWTVDQAGLDRPGNDLIQLALFLDYRSNPPLYPKWQAYLREHQPPMLVASGKNDPFFLPASALAIGNDNPNARVRLLNGGHCRSSRATCCRVRFSIWANIRCGGAVRESASISGVRDAR